MPSKPTIIVRNRPQDGNGEVLIIESPTLLKQSVRGQGGYWLADFFLPLGQGYDRLFLRSAYNSLLFHQVEIRVDGATTWRGVIWSMDLIEYGLKKRLDVGRVWNAWKTIYTLNDDKVQYETSWYENDASISQYGRRENLTYLDDVTLAQAQTLAQTELAKNAFPLSRKIGWTTSGDGLLVQCAGLIFTANNTYSTVTTLGEATVSSFVNSIISTDLEFFSPGNITTNSLTIEKEQRTPTRAWDLLLGLAELGDGTKPYLLTPSDSGLLSYTPLDATPLYEWHGEFGLRYPAGSKSGWHTRPGVLRDMTEDAGPPPPGSFLQDKRDAWIPEVEMWQGSDQPSLKPDDYNEDDLLTAKEHYERMMSDYTFDPLHTVTRPGGI